MKNVSSLWEDMVNGDLKGSIDCYGKDVLTVSTQNRKL